MHRRKFFLISLVLAVLAIGLHLMAMSQISRGVQIRARAVTLSETDRIEAKVEAGRYSTRGSVLQIIGLALALTSFGFGVTSARRHEPARRSVIIGLLIFYLMLQFVLV